MNKMEIARLVLNNHRADPVESHLLQAAGQHIDLAIQEILSYKADWAFLRKTARILTQADESDYALPLDCGNIGRMTLASSPIKPINPDNYLKFINYYDDSSTMSETVGTILSLTESPLTNVGYVFPIYGESLVTGVGTEFATRIVGRFFKTGRDGQVVRIKSFSDAEHLRLSQAFGGRSQAGKVNIYTDNLARVVGNPHVTNFTEDMIGLQIRFGGTEDNNVISSVDTLRQVLVLTANAIYGAGTDLEFSVQDTYEIDPPGVNILKLYPAPTEDDQIITIDYYATYTPLVGWNSVPIIPQRWHAAIVHRATMLFGSFEGSDAADMNLHQNAYQNILLNMQGNDDPLDGLYPYSIEPDPVRHETLRIED